MQQNSIKLSSGVITNLQNGRITVKVPFRSKTFNKTYMHTEYSIEQIMKLFYKGGDNRSQTIAKKLNMSRQTVDLIIQQQLKLKIAKINKRVNK